MADRRATLQCGRTPCRHSGQIATRHPNRVYFMFGTHSLRFRSRLKAQAGSSRRVSPLKWTCAAIRPEQEVDPPQPTDFTVREPYGKMAESQPPPTRHQPCEANQLRVQMLPSQMTASQGRRSLTAASVTGAPGSVARLRTGACAGIDAWARQRLNAIQGTPTATM